MTTLDLAESYELPPSRRHQDVHVEHVHGSMLRLPFDRASFELVTCISAIEHLDGDPRAFRRDPAANPQLPYDAYVNRTRAAIREMARVLAPGGLLYVTTDAYLPDRQFEDAWSPPNGVPRLWSAYRWEDIEGLFLDEAHRQGLRLVGEPDYGSNLLLGDRARSTYRGRFFTTFALLAEKPRVREALNA
jgi:SAM-dependent methyltransferase